MAKRKVRNYTEEFKRSSAKLAATSDQPISRTAKDIGVNTTTLHGWVNKYEPNTTKQSQTSNKDALAEELKQLRKENARLRQERDILKKATAYFAKETA